MYQAQLIPTFLQLELQVYGSAWGCSRTCDVYSRDKYCIKKEKKKALPIPLGSILTPLEANTAQRENSATCWLSVTVQGALITHSNKSYNGFTPLLLY